MIDKSIYLPLFKNSNVHFVGYGFKVSKGITTNVPSIQCAVEEKLPLAQIPKAAQIPSVINGLPTDVIVSKKVTIPPLMPRSVPHIADQYRPAPGGVSIGHIAITAGTLGCWVKDEENRYMFLSNNHVLANSNDAVLGDVILQPGVYDGGVYPEDEFGLLARFHKIEFGGVSDAPTCPIAIGAAKFANSLVPGHHHRLAAFKASPSENVVDCAVGMPLSTDYIDDTILTVGKINPNCIEAQLGLVVHKHGRTTGYNIDKVMQIDAAVQVEYGPGKTAVFVNQIIFGPMSAGGDSGSLILTKVDNRPVALLYAGSDKVTIGNPIKAVLSALNVHF